MNADGAHEKAALTASFEKSATASDDGLLTLPLSVPTFDGDI
jgi:hypothetical protein